MSGPYATEAPFVWDFNLDGKAVQEADDGGLILVGVASDYQPDRDEEYVAREGLAEGLKSYLATNPVILWQHDFSRPVGRCLSGYIDDEGLHIRAKLEPATHPASWQADLLAKVRAGVVKAFSIGGKFHRKSQGRVDRVDLIEISVCSAGVNPRALFRVEGLADVAGKAFAGGHDDTAQLREIKANLAAMKNALRGEGETMWGRKRTEPEARATLLRADTEPEEVVYARAQAQERNRAHTAAKEARTIDGPNAEHDTYEGSLASLYGIPLQRTREDNVLEVQEYDLSADQVAALHGQAGAPVDPRTQGESFLQMKEREARQGELRRKLLAPFDDLISRKEAATDA